MPQRFYSQALVLLAALLPSYLLRFQIAEVPTNAFEVLVIGLLIYGLIQPEVRSQWKAAWKDTPKPVTVLIGLFLTAVCISTIISPHVETSLGILKGWIIIPLVYAAMIYAATREISNLIRQLADQISNSLIISGVVIALLGISQLGSLERIRSLYDVPNSLALFLVPLIILAVFSAVNNYGLPHFASAIRQPRRRTSRGKRVTCLPNRQAGYGLRLYLLAALIMFLALLGTKSVAGIVAVIIVLAIALFRSKNYPTSLRSLPSFARGFGRAQRGAGALRVTGYRLLLTIFLGLTIAVAAPKINYLTQPNSSAHVRLQLWSVSAELIHEHPLLGIGLGVFEPAYQQKLHERFARITNYDLQVTNYPLREFVFRDPHNWLLSFWLNTGLLGLLSFAGLHAWIFYKLQITNYKLPAPALALVALLLFGLVDTIFWKNDLAALHFLLLALTVRR